MFERVYRKINMLSVPLVCCMLIGYFAYHAFYGGNGIIAAKRLKEHIAVLETDLLTSVKLRTSFEKKVALLRPESLDPDMVDEYARSILGMAHKNDVVILRPRSLENQ